MSGLHLSQFYGIEIDDFACEIARLAEHQLNSLWQQESVSLRQPCLYVKAVISTVGIAYGLLESGVSKEARR